MDEISRRRNMPILTMAVTQKLTGLSARQIRYYDENGLVQAARSAGGQRLFSLTQIDTLLEIKSQLSAGFTLGETKKYFEKNNQFSTNQRIDDEQAREYLFDELYQSSPFSKDNDGSKK